MEHYDVRRLALVLSVQAEVEGMKAENLAREQNNLAPAYGERVFNEKAQRLSDLAYAHNEQLI